jgi:hypothetical protein
VHEVNPVALETSPYSDRIDIKPDFCQVLRALPSFEDIGADALIPTVDGMTDENQLM